MRLIFSLFSMMLLHTTPSYSDPSVNQTANALIAELEQSFKYLYTVRDPKEVATHLRIAMIIDAARLENALVQRGVSPDMAAKVVNLLRQSEFQSKLASYITAARQNVPAVYANIYLSARDITRNLASFMGAITAAEVYAPAHLERLIARAREVPKPAPNLSPSGPAKTIATAIAEYLPAAAQLYFLGAVLYDVQNPRKSSFKDSLNQGIAIGLYGNRGRAEVKRVNPAYNPQTNSVSSSQ